MITLEPATEADALELAPLLREADRAEVLALGRDPVEALSVSVGRSAEAWTARDDGGAIICMGGVVPASLIGPTASPWLLGSPLVERHARTFLRETRRLVDRWSQEWPSLRNMVDARYERAHRWLRRIGFTVSEPRPLPPTGAMFCLAERERL